MPYRNLGTGEWDIPLGPVGIGALAIVGGAAFTLGQLNFYDVQFLPHLHLIGGWTVGLAVFASAAGTLLECGSTVWFGILC
jgi:hypothetical protein